MAPLTKYQAEVTVFDGSGLYTLEEHEVCLAADVDRELATLLAKLVEADETMAGAWKSLGERNGRIDVLKAERDELQAQLAAMTQKWDAGG